MALAVQPKRAQRQLEYERGVHAVSLKLTAELEAVTGAEHAAELKAARAEHAAERLLLLATTLRAGDSGAYRPLKPQSEPSCIKISLTPEKRADSVHV